MDAPPIQYARTEDGVNIAYWTMGEGPPLLVVTVPGMSHLHREWEVASLRKFYNGLASRFQVIRYNPRNTGLSDRRIEHLRLDDYVSDIQAVVDACTAGPVAILAYLASAPAISFAAALPERVSALVVVDGRWSSSDTQNLYGTIVSVNTEMLVESITNMVDPARSDHESLVKLVREAVEVDDRLRNVRAVEGWDVSSVMADVVAPALIIYSPRAAFGFEVAGREMASRMPNSQLVVREFERLTLADSLSDDVVSLAADFVAEATGQAVVQEADGGQVSGLRTILFTDLESSTALTQAVGDAKAQDVLHGHNDVVRAALAAHEGEEVKHTGDGIMASFGSAVSAVEAALAIQHDLAGGEVRVRVGLNAGEPIQEEGDLFGGSVQLAARVCDRAEPGQVLVSNVVRELCTGKLFQFADQGEATLKGFPEPVRLFAVEPPATAN